MKTVLLVNRCGEILTHANLTQMGVTVIAYDLLELLMKPGVDILQQQTSLAAYVGWPHQIVLDASRLTIHHEQVCLRSRFDGARIELSRDTLLKLIETLKPDWIKWPTDFDKSEQISIPAVDETIDVTDEPLQLALAGQVLRHEQRVEIADPVFQHLHEVLDPTCACETCTTGLTQAYLHHLWQAVPLLCQRFLALHHISQ